MTDRNERLLRMEQHPHVQSFRKLERYRANYATALAGLMANVNPNDRAAVERVEAAAKAACAAQELSQAEQFDAIRGETLLKQASRPQGTALEDVRGDYMRRDA